MPIVNGYCELDDLKQALNKITDTVDDPQLEMAIETASRAIDAECQRVFYTSGTTLAPQARYFSTRHHGYVRVDDLLTLVALTTDEDADGTYEITWAATDYRLKPINATVHEQPYTIVAVHPDGDYSFPHTDEGIKITGVWGYWTSVPTDIKQACLREAARIFRAEAAPFGTTGSGEFGTVTVTGGYDPIVRKLIAPYRKLEAG